MSTKHRHSLDNIEANLELASSQKKEILHELHTHFEEKIEELRNAGFSEEDATKITADQFGSAGTVAGELNQIHNPNNWLHAIASALPCFLFALLFALHQWHNILWLLAIFISLIGVVVYGWQHNKPNWFFTWLGYALIPLLIVAFILAILLGQALSLLPANDLDHAWWIWIAALVYFPFFLWLLIPIAIHTLKRDWLFVSLMALPIPVLAGWFLAIQQEWSLLGYSQHLYKLEPWIALSFVALAGVVILFVLFVQRSIKAGVILTAGLVTLVACSISGNIGLLNLAILTLVTLTLLIGPALLGHRIEKQENNSQRYLQPEKSLPEEAC